IWREQRQPPRVRVTAAINQAMATGVLAPVILLPEWFERQESADSVQAVLAHEASHVLHRDLWLRAQQRLLMLILFAHPLFWLLRAITNANQEYLADATARGEKPLDYAEILLHWFRTGATARNKVLTATVGLWERPHLLKRRISMVLNENFPVERSCPSPWRVTMWSVVTLSVLALSCVTLHVPAQAVAQEAKQKFKGQAAKPKETPAAHSAHSADSVDQNAEDDLLDLRAEYHLPRHVSVLPVAFISSDQQPPTPAETEKFLKHLKWAQDRYRQLLNGDTFDLAQPTLKLVRSNQPLAFYRTAPENGAPAIVSELLTELKVSRYACPYIFCIMLMNSEDQFPAGGGRPINGGLNTGGGMMYISSQQLEANEHYQATLQHELGHAFGLPHVDVYSHDMNSSPSLMSYNPAHFTKGFESSPTPGILLPEDIRALALNRRVFAKATFDPKRDVPAVYPLAKRIATLGPMTLPEQPDFYARASTNGGEAVSSKVGNIVSEDIFPNIGPGLNYFPNTMWHSVHKLPTGSADVELTFPMSVRLTGISFHSKHSNMDHHIASVKVKALNNGSERSVVEKSLSRFDELVTFPPATSQKWRLNLTPGPSGTLVVRGLRFFDGDEEVFPHQVPYQNADGVDDTRPGKHSAQGAPLAQVSVPQSNLAKLNPIARPTADTAEAKTENQGTEAIANTSGKATIPDAKAQAEARKTVKEEFASEYAQARKSAGKVALAIAFIEKAAQIDEANAERYIMLTEALTFAAEAGETSLIQHAVKELEKLYNVSSYELKERALSAAAFTGKTFEEATRLLTKYVELAAEAANAEDYATSKRAMLSAARALKLPLFKPLKEYANLESKRYTQFQEANSVVKGARTKLAENPADPTANLICGRFLCFYMDKWDEGLPLLAKSDDKIWKSIAEREIAKPALANELFRLGDDWQKAADRERDPIQFQARARAALTWDAAVRIAHPMDRTNLQLQLDQRIAKLFDKSIVSSHGNASGVPLDETESLSPGVDFTLEFWFATTSKDGIVFSKHHTDADWSLRVRFSEEAMQDPRLNLEIARGSGAGGSSTSNTYSDGHWHHMALVKQGAAVNVYVDGKSVISRTMQGSERLESGSPWKLGCGKGGSPLLSQFARIRISNVARYTKEFSPQKQYIRDFSTMYLR
ncbi:MAG: hypothetical protein JWM11_1731, partial [Planctomycetaceae bacterium]|nr:hypothetical protein [Planctomycetaceae bacterium]